MTDMTRLLKPLRDAEWLDEEPVRIYRLILAVLLTLASAGWILFSKNGLDPLGKPLGTDFLSFWTASEVALDGHPAAAYDVMTHAAAQKAVFDAGQGYAAFFYPPVYLLLCLPLATMSYGVSLIAWLALSGLAYAQTVWRFLGRWDGAWLTLLAFPAVMINMGHGQNGFLTAALAGAGVLMLGRRPWLAGVLFGCLVIKPHMALLIPFALAVRGLWKPFVTAGLTAAGLMALSAAVFGLETWRAFLANTALARHTLETGLVEPWKMDSIFGATRLLHGGIGMAYALQAAVTLATIVTIILIARAKLPAGAQNAALLAGATIATPFILDYDLTWTALPLAWLFTEARRTGFLPWERLVMAAAFALPLFARTMAMNLSLPIAPIVLIALFWTVVRRGWAGRPA